jgi:hypothetical protein
MHQRLIKTRVHHQRDQLHALCARLGHDLRIERAVNATQRVEGEDLR